MTDSKEVSALLDWIARITAERDSARAELDRADKLEATLVESMSWAQWHRDHPGTINHNAILFDIRARAELDRLRGASHD